MPATAAAYARLRQRAEAEHLDTITVAMVLWAIKSLAGTKGIGLDLWHPKELLQLPVEALSELRDLLNEVEKHMVWPRQIYLNKMVFLNKPGGGDRTIGLGTLVFRIWQKIRSPKTRAWEAKFAVQWDGASTGQGAVKSTYRREAFAEMAVTKEALPPKSSGTLRRSLTRSWETSSLMKQPR